MVKLCEGPDEKPGVGRAMMPQILRLGRPLLEADELKQLLGAIVVSANRNGSR